MNLNQILEKLNETKKLEIDDIDPTEFYSFKVFHIPQNRDMGTVKKSGKELIQFLKNKSFTIDKIKLTTSPIQDKQLNQNAQKAKAKFMSALNGKR